ncbi:TetR/AcrR family transcriptional regulator [Glycomyces niveus]|uniref:TetR family transcriptional regulator n=1 Tax=Glycomyces niveus TaxID=2820287 RepID=A0ABS3U9V4_9ACTN|nr:TetR/AcrR family transcriptional regulator [Glycomyces sp. NEAU-S30]MBO3734523.1 TetR family transcriptional regulator [Glycomyces sp. NEAU-S30]
MNTTSTKRTERAAATRDAIVTAAERLFAEQGVQAVSNRQISEAAGQGNNAAVGYHFGAKADLIREIVRRHVTAMEPLRARMYAAIKDSEDLRDWVACLVVPVTEHYDSLGRPSWFARFAAQVQFDPRLRAILEEEALRAESLDLTVEGISRYLPDLPEAVAAQRFQMVQMLMVLTPAAREAAIAKGEPVYGSSWREAGDALVDAIVGLLQAPHHAAAGGPGTPGSTP